MLAEIVTTKHDRIDVFDILKGIGIVLVIIGHFPFDNSISKFVYSFHMPLFFLITGCLYSTKNNISFIKILQKCIFKILIPYVVFVLISLFVFQEPWNISNLIVRLFNIRAMGPNVALWFLPLYFIAILCFVLILKLQNKIQYITYIFNLLFMLITIKFQQIFPDECILMLGVLPPALSFMCFGYEFYKNKHVLYKNNFLINFTLFTLGIILLAYTPITHIAAITSYFYFLCALCFCYVFYGIASNISSKVLTFIGKNSIYYLGLHGIIIHLCYKWQLFNWVNKYFNGLFLWILTIIVIITLTTVVVFSYNQIVTKLKKLIIQYFFSGKFNIKRR